MIYSINYDLRGKEADYLRLYRLLRRLNAKPVTESHWFVSSPLTAKKLTKMILSHVNKDDDVFVAQIVKSNVSGRIDRKRWRVLVRRKWLSAQQTQ